MIHVFLNTYTDAHPARDAELRYVEAQWRAHAGVLLHILDGRPTFDDVFARTRAVNPSASDICIILNSDCYIAPEIIPLFSNVAPGEFWCLSRWDVDANGGTCHHGYEFSQDVWAWRGRLDDRMSAPFYPGTSACDGSLAARAHRLGYALKNPSMDVKCLHYHHSTIRRWQDKPLTPGPHKYVQPHRLGEVRHEGSLAVMTLAVKPHYYELAHNLALSCWLHGVAVHAMTDEVRGDPIFASEILVKPQSLGCEDVWRLKPTAVTLKDSPSLLAFVDSDCFMLNSAGPVEVALEGRSFHQPAERQMQASENWAFPEPARDIARRYGIPDSQPLPQINGGFFCWRPGDEARAWLVAFEHALAWCTKELGIKREECAMMLANAKLGHPLDYSDTCISLWVTGNRSYDPRNMLFTCTDEYGARRRPTFGHFGSANTVPRVAPRDFGVEYRKHLDGIKQECLRRGLPAHVVHFAEHLTHPTLP